MPPTIKLLNRYHVRSFHLTDPTMTSRGPDKSGKKVWWFTLPEKRKPNNFEIPKKYKDIFLSKQVKCDIYHGLTEDYEREMFRRVQLGMVLTSAGNTFIQFISR